MIEVLLIDPKSGAAVAKELQDGQEWSFREGMALLADRIAKDAGKEAFEILFNLDPMISVRVT